MAHQIEQDYRLADLDAVTRGVLDYAVKLTRHPGGCGEEDVDALRALGLDDAQIHNVVFTTSYFNFINRVAEGLGVDPEPELADKPPLPKWA